MGPDPDRILLIGSGAVTGIGVTSHELGIGGHLARRLSHLTGRGADVELIGATGLHVTQIVRRLADVDLERFDAVVLMVGTPESVGMKSMSAWDRELRALLTHLRAASASLEVFVVGVAALSDLLPFKRLGPVVERQVARMNETTAAVCQSTGAHFIPFSPNASGESRYTDTATYVAWSEPIAVNMYRTLDAATAGPLTSSLTDEEHRQASLDALQVVDTPPEAEIDAIVRVARDLFGVASASVNLIDHERQWMKAAVGMDRIEVPREGTFCSIAIQRAGILVVEDAKADEKFCDLPSVEFGVRFYAGYPIEAPNGQRIGTLCLIDSEPRTFTPSDASLLRELALRVQSQLWMRTRSLALS